MRSGRREGITDYSLFCGRDTISYSHFGVLSFFRPVVSPEKVALIFVTSYKYKGEIRPASIKTKNKQESSTGTASQLVCSGIPRFLNRCRPRNLVQPVQIIAMPSERQNGLSLTFI